MTIMKDGLLAGTKIMAEGMDTAALYKNRRPGKRCFAEYNLGFLQDMRRFTKSDEDMVPAVQYRIRHNPDDHGVINYITCQDGFTLNDLVSYNYKHNEANGKAITTAAAIIIPGIAALKDQAGSSGSVR